MRVGDRPLKICLLGYRSDPRVGGQGVYLYYLSRALSRLGHRVTVLSGDPLPELDPEIELIRLPGLDLYRNGLASLRPRHLLSLANTVEWCSKLSGGFAEPWAFCRRAAEYLEQHGDQYDIIHDNQSLGYGLLDIQKRGLPLLATIHHPITRDLHIALDQARGWRQRWLLKRWYSFIGMQARVARRLAKIVAVSEQAKADIATDFGLAPERIEVIHNGIDSELYRPQPDVPRQSQTLVCTASADHPLKGLRFLLEAMAVLSGDFPALKLIVIGRLKPGGQTQQLLRRLNIGERVHFAQELRAEAIAQHYAAATMAIVPSLYEGFGFPAGEAMACATPVISTDGGALPEITGTAAEQVRAGDARELATAISTLLADSVRRQQLGEAGRQRVLSQFTWERAAERLTGLYRERIACRAAGSQQNTV